MSESKRFFKGPSAVLVDLLNPIALAGWSYVAYLVATTAPPHSAALQPALALELICCVEVLRMVLSDLPGNLVLGAVLHSIRILALTVILPRTDPSNAWLATAVLGAWAATEVSRYPMYVVKGVSAARLLRMVVPMATFPLGCGAEAYSAWLVFQQVRSLRSARPLLRPPSLPGPRLISVIRSMVRSFVPFLPTSGRDGAGAQGGPRSHDGGERLAGTHHGLPRHHEEGPPRNGRHQKEVQVEEVDVMRL